MPNGKREAINEPGIARCFYITNEQNAELTSIARQCGVSTSRLVRKIISDFIEGLNTDEEEQE